MIVKHKANPSPNNNSPLKTQCVLKLKKKIVGLSFILFITSSSILFANNLQISNVSLNGKSTAGAASTHFIMVQFDVSWENSWRTSVGPSNYDGAWVFVKFRRKTGSVWNHAKLNWVAGTGAADGHTVPANTSITSKKDYTAAAPYTLHSSYGVFIYRDADMAQANVSYTGVKLQWDYFNNDLTDADSVEVCVYGIEMVYVPTGAFSVGTLGSEDNAFYKYSVVPVTPNLRYSIANENAITVGTAANNLYYGAAGGAGGDGGGPIPAAFPKGYNAFWCMKYEITNAQYVAFLNKLDPVQAAACNIGYNSYILFPGAWPNYTCDATTSPTTYARHSLSYLRLLAYLDWAALRPMTELEFEKACRGNLNLAANEYAWGSVFYEYNTGISNEFLSNMVVTPSTANLFDVNTGAVAYTARVGCLGNGVNTREGTGSSYYGIMDLSGNAFEQAVTVGNVSGRAFTGVNGDGAIDPAGDANATNWSVAGGGFRGGGFNSPLTSFRISDRSYAIEAGTPWVGMGAGSLSNGGGRGVRTP